MSDCEVRRLSQLCVLFVGALVISYGHADETGSDDGEWISDAIEVQGWESKPVGFMRMFRVYGTDKSFEHSRASFGALKSGTDTWTLIFQVRQGNNEDTGFVCANGRRELRPKRLICTVENTQGTFKETMELGRWNWRFCRGGELNIPVEAAAVFDNRAACYRISHKCRASSNDQWGECLSPDFDSLNLAPPAAGSGRGGSRRGG